MNMSLQAIKCPEPAFSIGESIHGFSVIRVEQMPDIRVTAYEIEHEKTGAKILHLHCDDKENVYSIGFRTPPPDSTGVPHILEHAVLAGSHKYPLKDTFNELMRGTLQTFINAFTYPDKTIYPVASQQKKDFFNLARVYTDLVLRPRLLKETFLQEGHHLEFSIHRDKTSELMVSGIVYNEMKGAYSSPESLVFKAIQENLYPDTTYAFDSGGAPDVIPSLTYESFKEFHRSYYSPSNARIFLYGDISTLEHMEFLSEMLEGFERVEINSSVSSQRRWQKPSYVHGKYPVGKNDDTSKKTYVNMAWMMSENTDNETAVLLEILSGLLMGSAAGPLRKALIDSGLGEDMSPVSGIERDLKQIAFVVGLRGSEKDKAKQIEDLILETLKKIVICGFDRELIEGTLHQVEFHGKEIIRSSVPYGIILMGRAYHTWLYDGDPLANLNFPRIMENIRKKWQEKPEIFQDAVKKWFLDNTHRLLSVMEPSTTYQSEKEAEYNKKMTSLKERLSDDELSDIDTTAAALKKFQAEPDQPEAYATIPKISAGEISREIETIPSERANIEDVTAVIHEVFTNGIVYADLAFDIADIPEELQLYLPLLGKLAINMGAAGFDYEEMSKRIMLKTGGIGYSLSSGINTDGRNNWQKLIFRLKALHRNTKDAVNIASDILTNGDLSDESRMRDLVLERKNGLHASVVPSGHVFARRAASAALSLPAFRDEQWHGRTQLRFMNQIAQQFEGKKEDLQEKISLLRRMIFCRERLYINLTADTEGLSLLKENLANLVRNLPETGAAGDPKVSERSSRHIGVAIPAQVAYVAMAMAAPSYGDPRAASLFTLSRLLSNDYLYKNIRVQGGAYGGMSHYDPMSGVFSLLSYRDPNIIKTIDIYRGSCEFISKEIISKTQLEKTIVGTIGALDRPMDPSSRGYVAMIRDFSGITDQYRTKFRNDILDMSPETLYEHSVNFLDGAVKSAVVAVYADEESLKMANETLTPSLELETIT